MGRDKEPKKAGGGAAEHAAARDATKAAAKTGDKNAKPGAKGAEPAKAKK
jgi:hypothetical protein